MYSLALRLPQALFDLEADFVAEMNFSLVKPNPEAINPEPLGQLVHGRPVHRAMASEYVVFESLLMSSMYDFGSDDMRPARPNAEHRRETELIRQHDNEPHTGHQHEFQRRLFSA